MGDMEQYEMECLRKEAVWDREEALEKELAKPDKFTCYQCDKEVAWLAADSRCKDCTHLTPQEIRGWE